MSSEVFFKQVLKHPKFTIHHSTTSHVCLITDNESVQVEFSSLNLYHVEKVADHNVILLRVKQLRTYYDINITRHYLLFGSEHHVNVFFETISKLVHEPRNQNAQLAPPMIPQTQAICPLLLDFDDEVIAEDPSNVPYPPQLNESVEVALMPFQRVLRDPSVAPIRRGPVRVIRAPPNPCQLQSRAAETPATEISIDEEIQTSLLRTRHHRREEAVMSVPVDTAPKIKTPLTLSIKRSFKANLPRQKRGRPPYSQIITVAKQKKQKTSLNSTSQP